MKEIQTCILENTYNEPKLCGVISYSKDELWKNFDLERIIGEVASVFHENWRKTFWARQ